MTRVEIIYKRDEALFYWQIYGFYLKTFYVNEFVFKQFVQGVSCLHGRHFWLTLAVKHDLPVAMAMQANPVIDTGDTKPLVSLAIRATWSVCHKSNWRY